MATAGLARASVVVVTRDRADRLRALLGSLERQEPLPGGFEVVVVDDASSDATPQLVDASSGLAVTSLRVDDRPGLAELRNRGWRAARGELVAFIDDDCEADPGWLGALVAAGDGTPGGLIQGRTMPIPAELERQGPLTRTKRIEGAGPWYQTCNIAYPRVLLERLGGFDPRFSVAGEDTDLAWRAIEAGAPVRYEPAALALHAVEEIGFDGWIRIALRERRLAELFARHPGLRDEVATLGIFKSDHHALFALALAGVVLGRRFRPALLLGLPYARLLAARCRGSRAAPWWAAWFAAYDALAVCQSARGAAEHRAPLI